MKINTRTVVLAAAVLTACPHGTASAQTEEPTGSTRPYRALFGGSTSNPDVHHSLDISGSVEGGYDDGEITDSSFQEVSPLLAGGVYSGFSGNVAYAWRGRRQQFAANVETNMRYYTESAELVSVGHSASVGFSGQLSERFRVFANQSVSYSPSYLFGLMPTLGGPMAGTVVGSEAPDGSDSVFVYDTSASATFSLTRRASLEGLGGYRYSDLGPSSTIPSAVPDLKAYSVGGRYRHSWSRYAAVRIGYVYRAGQYGLIGTGVPTAVHDIDTGVDYRRPLSFTRRTTMDFGVGSAILNTPLTDQSRGLQYRLVGSVGFTHEMGRSWRSRVAYNRGVEFVEAFAQPVFADGLTGSLTGFFNRRTDFSLTGGFSTGDVGLASEPSSFRTYSASTRIRFAVSSIWAVYADHLFYYHNLGTAILVPTGVPGELDRQTVRVGLTLWVPFLRR